MKEAMILEKPSTFTFPGRHSVAWAYMLALTKIFTQPTKIICLRPGPLEPSFGAQFVAKELNCSVIGVDSDPRIIELGEQLLRCQEVPLKTLAETCVNNRNTGPMLNTDLEVAGFQAHQDRLVALLGNSCWHHDDKTDMIRATHEADLCNGKMFLADVLDVNALPWGDKSGWMSKFRHILFAGALLVNLRKIHGDARVSQWLHDLHSAYYADLLVVSLTPYDLTREQNTLKMILKAGFHVSAILCDQFVHMGEKTLGDFEVICEKASGNQTTSALLDRLHPLLQPFRVQNFLYPNFDFTALNNPTRIPVAWITTSGHSKMYTGDISEMKEGKGHRYWDDLAKIVVKGLH